MTLVSFTETRNTWMMLVSFTEIRNMWEGTIQAQIMSCDLDVLSMRSQLGSVAHTYNPSTLGS